MSDESIKLPTVVNIDVAQDALHLATTVRPGKMLTVNAEDVESIDGPAVIVFANIAKTLSEREQPVAVIAPSTAFVEGFTDLGLYDELMKMEFQK